MERLSLLGMWVGILYFQRNRNPVVKKHRKILDCEEIIRQFL